MKLISILVPCYNECNNVGPLARAIEKQFDEFLSNYQWEIIFIDNFSTDGTRDQLEMLCGESRNIKAIFNANNFGGSVSAYYGMCQTHGDCTIVMAADFQDPPELITELVKEWENGYKIVVAVKNTSEENKLMYFMRSCYYSAIKKLSSVNQIEHFTGFGLYDRSFVDVLRSLDDPHPYLRGIVAEFGANRKYVYFRQAKRRSGKTHVSFMDKYDEAMRGFTSYTKLGLRIATILGFCLGLIMLVVSFGYFIAKLVFWNSFPIGIAPAIIGMFFLGAMQLFFLGFMGEYILSIHARSMHRPLVIEERRLNL